MRKVAVLACFCLFTSCDWFTSKEERTQELVNEEMRNINFNEVDRYPLFDNCDEMMDKAEQLDCFQNTLLDQYTETLEDFEFQFVSDVNTNIYVDFLVDYQGEISVLEVQRNEDIENQIPEFRTIITQSLKGLPPLSPALKRGVPVSSKFRIPIIVNSK
ncbi:hypothetical protein QSE00_12365 [Arenibacter sp. M-2]|uniref:hypothetical protein n=1 Tax=unclassified Arenibacter TaxID=2615047 RepID=UPI000D75B65B|nr:MULTISPECIES: hypothetical protein [unclassified Arenibacter]MDL5512616.1 hypothetical protein [Arenibacter sp. M-2]PXX25947.1 hypothetical protein C7972_11072 [Arenibacter sp. ARW7G5Y1]